MTKKERLWIDKYIKANHYRTCNSNWLIDICYTADLVKHKIIKNPIRIKIWLQ